MNNENGTRLSTALTYLTDEVWSRDNLTIRGKALVDTVRFEQRCATGVRLVGGEEIDADTVILAAGTLGSAAILLRSESDLRLILPGLASRRRGSTRGSALYGAACKPRFARDHAGQARRDRATGIGGYSWRVAAVARTGRLTCT